MNNDGCWKIIAYYYNDYSAKPEIIFESIKGLQINYPVSTKEVGEKVIEHISSIFLTLPLSEKSIILMDDDIKKAIIVIERQLEERKE